MRGFVATHRHTSIGEHIAGRKIAAHAAFNADVNVLAHKQNVIAVLLNKNQITAGQFYVSAQIDLVNSVLKTGDLEGLSGVERNRSGKTNRINRTI